MSSDLFVPEYIYSGRVGLLLPTPLAAVIVYIYVHRCCTVEFNNSLHISTHSLERSIKKLLKEPYYFKYKHKNSVPFPRM